MMKFILTAAFMFVYFLCCAQNLEIIYTSQKNYNDNIQVVNNKGQIKVIMNNSRKDSSPIISSDGKHIVFSSERVGWWKIWSYDIENNKYTQLTNSSNAEYSPAWSPNNDYIVFVSSRDGNQEIYTMSKEGLNLKNITKNTKSDLMPFWGKDNRIYYSSEINGTYQIVSCNPNGKNKVVLTNTKGNKLMPQISNDLKQILYYGDEDGNFEIYLMDMGAKKSKRLTNHPLMDMRPRWSPDNKQIVFERGNKGNNHHIYLMDINGENQKQLTFSNYNYSPSFVPFTKSFFN